MNYKDDTRNGHGTFHIVRLCEYAKVAWKDDKKNGLGKCVHGQMVQNTEGNIKTRK